jgi:hypothetical protein
MAEPDSRENTNRFIEAIEMRVRSTDPSPLQIRIVDQEADTISMSRAAAGLIADVYWPDTELKKTIEPLVQGIMAGRGPKAISLRRLAVLYPRDFDGVAELLVGLFGEEPWGSPNLFEKQKHADDIRSTAEIAHDDEVIAEIIRRRHGYPPSRGDELVIGKASLRRRWNADDGHTASGRWVTEPEDRAGLGDVGIQHEGAVELEAAATLSASGAVVPPTGPGSATFVSASVARRIIREIHVLSPTEIAAIVEDELGAEQMERRLADQAPELIASTNNLLLVIEDILGKVHAAPGMGHNLPEGAPALVEVSGLEQLRDELTGFRDQLQAVIEAPSSQSKSTVIRGAGLLKLVKAFFARREVRTSTVALSAVAVASIAAQATGVVLTTELILGFAVPMIGGHAWERRGGNNGE